MGIRRAQIRGWGINATLLLPLLLWGCAWVHSSREDDSTVKTEKPVVQASPAAAPATAPAVASFDAAAVARIRDEGMNRSQVMQTLSYLTDVIGPRLTGSPNLKRANEWTRDQMKSWGLENAALEAWGPFGRGWSVKRFSAEVTEPQSITLIGYPKAWSGGIEQPIEAEVVLIDIANGAEQELQLFSGKLEGKIVLIGSERPVRANFTANGARYSDEALRQLAAGRGGRGPATAPTSAPGNELLQPVARGGRRGGNAPASNPTTVPAAEWATRVFNFVVAEKAALIGSASTIGDGGTVFVSAASLVAPPQQGRGGGRGPTTRVWSAEGPVVPPQMTLAVEHFNRLARMIKAGEKVKMAVTLQVQYHTDDAMAYNTIAEIPGTDLKDQIVMVGGHLDSWHSGTGATDNGAGVAVALEAVRILRALNLQPRRTIRVALWTGEEQGLFGSAQYVAKHFGTVEAGRGRGGGGARGRGQGAGARGGPPATAPTSPRVVRGPEYDNLSAYFNLDNGTGKIRGVYLQGNAAAGPIFKSWLAPFADLGATTIAPGNTGSTDHVSFDNIGLPGFQFIQDQIEYNSRTHHSNADVFDRIQADDMKQAATIMAAFVYNAAMMNERIPRKPGFAPAPASAPSQITADLP